MFLLVMHRTVDGKQHDFISPRESIPVGWVPSTCLPNVLQKPACRCQYQGCPQVNKFEHVSSLGPQMSALWGFQREEKWTCLKSWPPDVNSTRVGSGWGKRSLYRGGCVQGKRGWDWDWGGSLYVVRSNASWVVTIWTSLWADRHTRLKTWLSVTSLAGGKKQNYFRSIRRDAQVVWYHGYES